MISKLPTVGTTIFTTMSKLAVEHNAINLSQGFPNFPVDPQLVECLVTAANSNTHQYAPMAGNTQLMERLAVLTHVNYGRTIDPASELLITAGATQAIFTTIQALIHANDEVIILDPSYDCYDPAIQLVGAKAVHVNMTTDFLPDWDAIEQAITANTKLLIINNPHNPSGKILNRVALMRLEALLAKYPSIYLLSDEVYEYITFEEKHISVNTIQNLRNKSIIVSSFGKTFHITGWKIGYLIAPEEVMREIKKVHQFLVFSVNSVAQAALSDYLAKVDVQALGKFYQEKRDFFRTLLKNSQFELMPSEGTYFQTVSYRSISDASDTEFVSKLVKEVGVAAIPFSGFYADKTDRKQIRFCFAKDHETLEKAGELLCKI